LTTNKETNRPDKATQLDTETSNICLSLRSTRHLSQPCHRLGPCQGDRQRKQQNEWTNGGSGKRYTSEKNKTSRWTETRDRPTNFTSTIT